jgi:tetratricopeptide (TPR) repeat protein
MNQYKLAVYYYQVQATFYNCLGKLQIERGKYKKAHRYFRKALKSRPLDEEYKTNCGKALLLIGNEDNIENAEKLFFEILQQNDENSRANYYQGSVMMKKGDYDAALICFSKCLRLNHHRPVEVNLKKGLVLLVREQFDDALECFQVARRLDPNNVCALNYIGCIHNLRGEEKKALRYHNRCQELDPNYVITCNRGQTLSCLRSVSGQEDLEEMVIWFQNQNLQLSGEIHLSSVAFHVHDVSLIIFHREASLTIFISSLPKWSQIGEYSQHMSPNQALE